jgi:integrase/recombinase XerD
MNTINNVQLHTTPSQLQHLFETYITDCKYSKHLRPQTLKGYLEVFSVFQKLLPDIKEVDDLHPHLMNEFFKRLSTRERKVGKDTIKIGVRPSTIRTYYNKLMPFFRWLEIYGHIENGVLTSKIIKPPVPIYDDEKALSEWEVSKIIASITLYSINDPFIYKRDILIVTLLLYTGIRKGELLALRIQDIDFEKRSLFINGQTSKSKKSRFIPLHFTLITHLKVYLKERQLRKSHCDALIISSKNDKALTEYGLKHWVQKYINLSGVKFHIHRFRHTFACTLAKENADLISIMNVMGHSSTQMTERYLRSITSEHSRPFIEKLSF